MAVTDEEVPFSREMLTLLSDFKVQGGAAVLPKESFERWKAVHSKILPAARKARAVELMAVAFRFRKAGTAGSQGMRQLAMLAALTLGSKRAAEDMFETAEAGWRRGRSR